MQHFLKISLAVLMLASLIGCTQATPPSPADSSDSAQPTPEPAVSAFAPTREELLEDQIQDYLSNMTTEEKVGQLFLVRCPGEHAAEDVSTYHLGGYILFGQDTKGKTADQLIGTIRSYQDAAEIPLLIGVDEEGGTVVRVSSNPNLRAERFPSPQDAYKSGGMEAVISDTAEKDQLLHSLGINLNLAPVCDLSTDPADFIYDRSFGQEARPTADYISAVTAQTASDKMGTALKHFPGYGGNLDTHTGASVDNRPLEHFRENDFLPFSAGFASGGPTTSVMVSHNIMAAVDDQLPASLSPAVHRLLREELGFEGVVMTDDLAMGAASVYEAPAVLALQAGNDILLTTDYRTQIPQILAALESGEVTMEQVDAACARVLRWKQVLGLLPDISEN